MIKNFLFSALVLTMVSCGQNGPKEKKTESGFNYEHVSVGGEKVKEGDYVFITFKMEGSNGDLLNEMGEGPDMPIMQIPTADKPLAQPNPVIDMLKNGGVGDSMTLYYPIDSLPEQARPTYAGMEYIKYSTWIKEIKDETGYKAYMEERRLETEKQLEEVKTRADLILSDYNDGKLDVQTTEEGLKYVILKEGDGPRGDVGTKATVHYYGTLMDGKMFDSSFIKGRPFTFEVGRQQVIRGWDLGIPLLKKGGSATLFIPSDLGYGAAGSPPRIPGDSELMFYVELVDVD